MNPSKLKRLRRIHYTDRVVRRRIAIYNNIWRITEWDGVWKLPSRVSKEGPNEDVGLVHSFEKWNMTCRGRGCRCHRNGRYKYREAVGRKRKYRRKGWNKIKRKQSQLYFESEFERWIAEDLELERERRILEEIDELYQRLYIRLSPYTQR